MDNNNITLSVVMPAYNEEQHIKDNLLETSRILKKIIFDVLFFIVGGHTQPFSSSL